MSNNTVFNIGSVNSASGLFLAEEQGLSIQRFDKPKHPNLLKLLNTGLGFFWLPEEISMAVDAANFNELTEADKHVVISNIKRQILLDSVMGRAPDMVFGPAVNDPVLEGLVKWWSMQEVIHSKSYTHIIQNSFPDPEAVLSGVMDIEEIVQCSNTVAYFYDKCIADVQKFYDGEISRQEACKSLYLALHAANALESIRFAVSFACSFAYAENGLLPGLGNIISLINRDECLVGDTEVLTTNGWKYIKDISISDKVAQFDTATKEITFVNPDRVVKKPTLEIHKYSKRGFAQSVTPNHRMIVATYDASNGSYKNTRAIESKDFRPNSFNCSFISGVYNSSDKKRLTPIERLFIAIQADGYMSKRYTGEFSGHRPVQFSFSKQRKIDRIIQLFEECELEWKEGSETPSRGKRKAQRNFMVYLPVEIINNYDLKNLSSWINIENISQEWANDFFEELVLWDGYIPTDESCKYYLYDTTSKENADIVQIIGHLSGRLVTRKVKEDNRSKNFSDLYRCYIFKNKHVTTNQNMNRDVIALDEPEDMYCITVPTGAFMVRYDNKVSITGNCSHVAITNFLLKELPESDNDFLEAANDTEVMINVRHIWRQTYEEEKSWIDYLFSKGNILGLNATVLKQYLDYVTTTRLEAIGVGTIEEVIGTPAVRNNPINWINNWLSNKNNQPAPQETELTNYEKGNVDMNIDLDSLNISL